MGDGHHGFAGFCQFPDNSLHFSHHGGIKRAGGLVQQNNFRIHGKGAGNGNALFLAAGKLVGVVHRFFRQTHCAQQPHSGIVGFLFRLPQQIHGSHHDVLNHRFMAKKIKVLEHHAHLQAHFVYIASGVGDFHPVHPDLPGGRLFKLVDTAQKRTLTGAGRPDDADHIAVMDLRTDILQGCDVGILFFQMFDFNHRSLLPSGYLPAFCAWDPG